MSLICRTNNPSIDEEDEHALLANKEVNLLNETMILIVI
jgi:hypothetical protein